MWNYFEPDYEHRNRSIQHADSTCLGLICGEPQYTAFPSGPVGPGALLIYTHIYIIARPAHQARKRELSYYRTLHRLVPRYIYRLVEKHCITHPAQKHGIINIAYRVRHGTQIGTTIPSATAEHHRPRENDIMTHMPGSERGIR